MEENFRFLDILVNDSVYKVGEVENVKMKESGREMGSQSEALDFPIEYSYSSSIAYKVSLSIGNAVLLPVF